MDNPVNLLDYQPPPDLLEGRVLLVTGAGNGIGRAVARAAARVGATVILLGRTVSELEGVYDEILAENGHEPAIYPMNLEGASWQDYENLAATLSAEFARLDGLVHNAALFQHLTPLAHHDPQLWARILHVNLTVPFLLNRACLPLLGAAQAASVIFVSDEAGRRGMAYWGAYGVSKFGLEGLMQTFAEEVEAHTRIRANSLDPGPVRTAMHTRIYPEETEPGVLKPEQVTPAFLYLLGRDSKDCSGQAFSAQTPAFKDRD